MSRANLSVDSYRICALLVPDRLMSAGCAPPGTCTYLQAKYHLPRGSSALVDLSRSRPFAQSSYVDFPRRLLLHVE